MSTVQELLNIKGSDIWTIHLNDTAYRALEIMAARNVGALPVVENGQVVGIFSERDYARKVILKGRSSREMLVKELMTEDVSIVHPDNTLQDCMKIMTKRNIRHLPVLAGKEIAGIVTIGDVVKYIISQQRDVIQNLEAYIAAR